MFRISLKLSRPVIIVALVASLTAVAAVAGTIHTFAVTQTIGSEGAYDFLQTTVPAGALQGETGPAASTGLGTPFGVFGKYGPSTGTTTVGLGVVGISTKGWGVTGESLSGYPALYAFPNSKDGVGLDAESDNDEAVYATAHGSGDGVDANAQGDGYGVNANSSAGTGIEAFGGNGDGIDGTSGDSAGGDGVFGYSEGGNGVSGSSSTGYAVNASTNSGIGVNAMNLAAPNAVPTGPLAQYAAVYAQSQSGPGIFGYDPHDSGAVSGISYNRYTGVTGYAYDGSGVYGYSANNAGILAENDNAHAALVVENDITGTGDEILAGSGNGLANSTGFNYAVETNGNEYVGGSVTSGAGTFTVTRNPRTDTVTYGAEATEPMVEDVGSAHLVNGSAAVALAGDFRQTIQDASNYLVFLTPFGDAGLYVAARTPAGFVVRELHGGHATLDFAYRIVAQRYGVQTGRLPHLAALSPRMAQLRFAALHPSTSETHQNAPLRYAAVTPAPNERSTRAVRLALARIASAMAHARKTVPPTPPPGFLAGINR